MVSGKTVGGLFAGAAVAFGGILYWTVKGLAQKSAVLGCVASSPECQQVTAGISTSHVAVGFLSAMFSLGLYFLFFHNDTTKQLLVEHERRRSVDEQIALLGKVMAPGERAVLQAVAKEDGILQSTLGYRTNLTAGRISQVLSEFEEQGLVRRKPDGRSYRVYVSI